MVEEDAVVHDIMPFCNVLSLACLVFASNKWDTLCLLWILVSASQQIEYCHSVS